MPGQRQLPAQDTNRCWSTNTAQSGEVSFVVQTVVVIAGGYEQDGRAVRADAGEFEQPWVVGLDDRRDPAGERGGLGGELLDAVGQQLTAWCTAPPAAPGRRTP